MVKTLFAIALLGTFAYAQEAELFGNDDIFVISQKPDTIDEAMEKKRSHSFECTTVSTSAVNGLTSSELLEKYQEAMREYNDEHLHDKVMSSLTN